MFLQQITQTPHSVWEVFLQLKDRLLQAIPSLLTGLIVLVIFWTIAAIGARVIAYTAPRVKADTGAVLLLSRAYYYTVLSFGLITALSTTGLNVSALITGLGLTGFALGFALKDVLSNLLSGIMLLLYRPFHLGDNITMGQYTGTIQMIRMRDTILRDDEGRIIVIPNSKLITEVVVNNSTATKPIVLSNEKKVENRASETEPESFNVEKTVENVQ